MKIRLRAWPDRQPSMAPAASPVFIYRSRHAADDSSVGFLRESATVTPLRRIVAGEQDKGDGLRERVVTESADVRVGRMPPGTGGCGTRTKWS
jgi:hypothetical protein